MQETASGSQPSPVSALIGPTRAAGELGQTSKLPPRQHHHLSRDHRSTAGHTSHPRHTMFSSTRARFASAALSAARPGRLAATRASYSVSASRFNSETTSLRPNDAAADGKLAETTDAGERSRELQAPNRASTWAKSQAPRAEAMSGPRFEQTILELQVSRWLCWSIEWF
jgi:hypothetical protein